MTRPAIRRVLVAVDASEPSRGAAEAAAELAAALAIELAGLFVEDRELLALAGLPSARRVDSLTAAAHALEGPEVERQLRAQGVRARALLERAASRRGAPCSFRIARGAVLDEIVAAAEPADLVALGRAGWTRGSGSSLGRTARALLERGEESLLLLPRRARPLGGVAVLFDGSASALAALVIGSQIAGGRGDLPLRVLVPLDLEDVAAAEEAAGEFLAERGVGARLERLPPHELAARLASRPGGTSQLLVVAAGPEADLGLLVALVESLDTPLLVLRP